MASLPDEEVKVKKLAVRKTKEPTAAAFLPEMKVVLGAAEIEGMKSAALELVSADPRSAGFGDNIVEVADMCTLVLSLQKEMEQTVATREPGPLREREGRLCENSKRWAAVACSSGMAACKTAAGCALLGSVPPAANALFASAQNDMIAVTRVATITAVENARFVCDGFVADKQLAIDSKVAKAIEYMNQVIVSKEESVAEMKDVSEMKTAIADMDNALGAAREAVAASETVAPEAKARFEQSAGFLSNAFKVVVVIIVVVVVVVAVVAAVAVGGGK